MRELTDVERELAEANETLFLYRWAEARNLSSSLAEIRRAYQAEVDAMAARRKVSGATL